MHFNYGKTLFYNLKYIVLLPCSSWTVGRGLFPSYLVFKRLFDNTETGSAAQRYIEGLPAMPYVDESDGKKRKVKQNGSWFHYFTCSVCDNYYKVVARQKVL